MINRANIEMNGPHASASAYITFERKADSLSCIMCIDGFHLEDRMLRASFGTTKYCNFYLLGKPCSNPECLYLHHVGEDQDCFSLEQMQNNKKYFREYTHPGPGNYKTCICKLVICIFRIIYNYNLKKLNNRSSSSFYS